MSKNSITSICGDVPVGFIKIKPTDSNFIFQNDPNFNALNLYDIFGRAATVNSYQECVYYVELGFVTEITTIFDILQSFLLVLVISFLLFKFFKSGVHKKIALTIFNFIRKTITSKKFQITSLYFSKILLFLGSNFYLFDYVKTKAVSLNNFIDEYIVLTSNVNFFKNLDFNAGEFIGGSYSIYLTSGPISAIGGVIGWIMTSDFHVSRVSNFYWIVLVQSIFIFVLFKSYKKESLFLVGMSPIGLILVPWWQGSLYMLGEFVSTLIFVNAVFLISKYRYLALMLFSISIFFGKFLILIPFAVFYLFFIFLNKEINKLPKDFVYLSLPVLFWISLINFNYENGNLIDYFSNLLNLISTHQSAGLSSINIIQNFNSSEVSTWNMYEMYRVAIVPLIFFIITYQNKDKIDELFGRISIPLIYSTFSIYLWYWLVSPTKWIRYSQHFLILTIFSIIYFINFDIFKSKIYLFFAAITLITFIDNNKFLIPLFTIYLTYLFLKNYFNFSKITKIIIILFITIDIAIPYIKKGKDTILDFQIYQCNESLISDDCLNNYIDN